MIRPKHFKVFGLLAALSFIIATPVVAQQHMENHQQQVKPDIQSMQNMMQQMQKMVNTSHNMLQQMDNEKGMGMMQGQDKMNEHQHQNMMQGKANWADMMQGADNMVNNMNKVMEQMQYLISNEKVMNSPQMKKYLKGMQKDMGNMMESMNSFLDNMKDVQQMQQPTQ